MHKLNIIGSIGVKTVRLFLAFAFSFFVFASSAFATETGIGAELVPGPEVDYVPATRVIAVTPGSRADVAGLVEGDVILGINHRAVRHKRLVKRIQGLGMSLGRQSALSLWVLSEDGSRRTAQLPRYDPSATAQATPTTGVTDEAAIIEAQEEAVFTPTRIVSFADARDETGDRPYQDRRYGHAGRVADWQIRPDGSLSPDPTSNGGWYITLEDGSILRDAGLGTSNEIIRAWTDYEGVRYMANSGYEIYQMLESLTKHVPYTIERVVGTTPPQTEAVSFILRGVSYDEYLDRVQSGRSVPPTRLSKIRNLDSFLISEAKARAARPEPIKLPERIVLQGGGRAGEILQAFMDGNFDALEELLTEQAESAAWPLTGGNYSLAVGVIERTRFARFITAYGLTRMIVHGNCGEPAYPLQWSTTTWTEYRNGFGHYRGSSAAKTTTETIYVPVQLAPAFARVDTVHIEREDYRVLEALIEQVPCRAAARDAIEANMAAFFRRDPPMFIQ